MVITYVKAKHKIIVINHIKECLMKKFSLNTSRFIIVTSLVCLCLFIVIGGYYKDVFSVIKSIWNMDVNPVSKQKADSYMLDPLPPAFKKALLSMYDKQHQMGSDSIMYELDGDTKITPEQGMCIYNLCRKIKPQRTLEIGMAYGFSTVYFLAAIKANNMGHHVAMDPFEINDWHGIGLKKVQELGMDSSFQLMQEYDIFGLPDMAREKLKFDVIFIDGNHRFDDVLLDFTLSDYVCADQGCIILHDLWMPSIKRVAKFIKNNRSDYEIQEDILAPRMMVFKKIAGDKRPWNHYISF
jgi:predicted O-methyltransferase YrrM